MANNKRGFTLLELIIVIVIISILSSLGFVQYIKLAEVARSAEAKAILGTIRKAQQDYYLSHNSYSNSLDGLSVSAPTGCTSTHYFYYNVTSSNATAYRCVVVGCCGLSGGKPPDCPGPYNITLSYDGTWSGPL